MSSAGDRVYDWLAYHARYNADSPACVDLGTGRRFTYAEINDRSTRLATGLAAEHGVGKGDRVAMIAANSTDFYELMFACWKLGALFMPLNWRLHAREIAALLEHGEPKALFCDPEFAPLAEGWDQGTTLIRREGSGSDHERLIAEHGPEAVMPALTGDDLNCLLYTSGTTGRPKGVMYNYRMTSNSVLCAALHAGMSRESVSLTYAPLFHTAGLNGAASLFHYGGCLNVMPGWDAAKCLSYLTDPEMGITHCVGVPTHYLMIERAARIRERRLSDSGLPGRGQRTGFNPAASHLGSQGSGPGAVVWPHGVFQRHNHAAAPGPRNARSAGHAMMHVEVQVGDGEGIELQRGEVGEIRCAGRGSRRDTGATRSLRLHPG